MHGKTIKRVTAAVIGAGLLTAGLMAGAVGAVLVPGAPERESVASAADEGPGPRPVETVTATPTPTPTETALPQPPASLPESERLTETVDFGTHTVTCSGDVYWDWQVGARARGEAGGCREWSVAMELDKDGPAPEQQELLDQWPECADYGPYEEPSYETSGEAQWDWAVQPGVIDEDGNYLDDDGYPTGETVSDDEG